MIIAKALVRDNVACLTPEKSISAHLSLFHRLKRGGPGVNGKHACEDTVSKLTSIGNI
jgi:hypothetical protein